MTLEPSPPGSVAAQVATLAHHCRHWIDLAVLCPLGSQVTLDCLMRYASRRPVEVIQAVLVVLGAGVAERHTYRGARIVTDHLHRLRQWLSQEADRQKKERGPQGSPEAS